MIVKGVVDLQSYVATTDRSCTKAIKYPLFLKDAEIFNEPGEFFKSINQKRLAVHGIQSTVTSLRWT